MTEPQQHVISHDDFKKIYEIEYPISSEERRRICARSRPAPSQPARLACQFDLQAYSKGETFFEDIRACSGESCNFCGRYTSQHDATIRNQTLDNVIAFIEFNHACPLQEPTASRIRTYSESLRTEAQHERGEQR